MCYRCGKVRPSDGPRLLLSDESHFIYRVGPNGSTATAIDNGKWEQLESFPGFSTEYFEIKGKVNKKWMKWKLRAETLKIYRRLNRGGYVDPFLLSDAGLSGEAEPRH
jgi:hypothetical protein